MYKTKKGFKSGYAYVWEKTPNYDEQLEFIKNCQIELNYLSEQLDISITYYEDLYDLNDKGRLRKGNRDEFGKSII